MVNFSIMDRGFFAETTQRAEGETYRQAITETSRQYGVVGMNHHQLVKLLLMTTPTNRELSACGGEDDLGARASGTFHRER
jgi:hypothetical protein